MIDTDSGNNSVLSAALLGSDGFFSAGALLRFEQRRQQVFVLRYDEKNNLLQSENDQCDIYDGHDVNDAAADDVLDAASTQASQFGTPRNGCVGILKLH